MKTFVERDGGGNVVIKKLSWVGPVKTVKVSKGKGQDIQTHEVYNITVRSGYHSFTTMDFDNIVNAQDFRDRIVAEIER